MLKYYVLFMFLYSWYLQVLSVYFYLQQKLNELRQWIDKVRNFDKSYITDNAVFYLDCSGVQETLVPKLSAILKELCTFVADESTSLAKKFCQSMDTALEVSNATFTTFTQFMSVFRSKNKYIIYRLYQVLQKKNA